MGFYRGCVGIEDMTWTLNPNPGFVQGLSDYTSHVGT